MINPLFSNQKVGRSTQQESSTVGPCKPRENAVLSLHYLQSKPRRLSFKKDATTEHPGRPEGKPWLNPYDPWTLHGCVLFGPPKSGNPYKMVVSPLDASLQPQKKNMITHLFENEKRQTHLDGRAWRSGGFPNPYSCAKFGTRPPFAGKAAQTKPQACMGRRTCGQKDTAFASLALATLSKKQARV